MDTGDDDLPPPPPPRLLPSASPPPALVAQPSLVVPPPPSPPPPPTPPHCRCCRHANYVFAPRPVDLFALPLNQLTSRFTANDHQQVKAFEESGATGFPGWPTLVPCANCHGRKPTGPMITTAEAKLIGTDRYPRFDVRGHALQWRTLTHPWGWLPSALRPSPITTFSLLVFCRGEAFVNG